MYVSTERASFDVQDTNGADAHEWGAFSYSLAGQKAPKTWKIIPNSDVHLLDLRDFLQPCRLIMNFLHRHSDTDFQPLNFVVTLVCKVFPVAAKPTSACRIELGEESRTISNNTDSAVWP